MLRRLALFAADVHPEMIPALSPVLVTDATFFDAHFFHEQAVLLSHHLGKLDRPTQTLVHRLLEQGPPRPEGQTNEEWRRHVDYLRWLWLAVNPVEHLTEAEQAKWNALVESRGVPDHPFFLGWHGPFEVVEMEPNVADADRLRIAWQSGGAADLVAVLRAEARWWTPLADLIGEDPEGFLSLAPILGPEDGERLLPYFESYERLLQTQSDPQFATVAFTWEPLLELMERVAAADLRGAPGTAREVARLIDSGVANARNPIPAQLLDRATAVTVNLLDTLAQPLDTDPQQGGQIGRNHQLNHPAGAAADAFMRCVWQALYLATDEQRRLPAQAAPWIAAALKRGWGGLEMRHAFGEFWFVLEWGEPGWLAAHVQGIWPAGADLGSSNARRAFLYGILGSREWRRSALEALRPVIREAIGDLAKREPEYFDEHGLAEPFVRLLVRGWLYDVDGFGLDGLVGEFVQAAPDAERSRFVGLLGREHRVSDSADAVDFPTTSGKTRRVLAASMYRTGSGAALRGEERGAQRVLLMEARHKRITSQGGTPSRSID